MKEVEVKKEEVVEVPATTEAPAPEVSANSTTTKPNLFNQLVACKESTTKAMDIVPENPTQESLEKLYNFVTLEQDTCLGIIKKIEPMVKDSLAKEEFAEALTKTKTRIIYEQKITELAFKVKVDAKNEIVFKNMFSLKMGLTLIKQDEDMAWHGYKQTLIKEQERIKAGDKSWYDFDWSFIIILLIVGGLFLIRKLPKIKSKYKEVEDRYKASEATPEKEQPETPPNKENNE